MQMGTCSKERNEAIVVVVITINSAHLLNATNVLLTEFGCSACPGVKSKTVASSIPTFSGCNSLNESKGRASSSGDDRALR